VVTLLSRFQTIQKLQERSVPLTIAGQTDKRRDGEAQTVQVDLCPIALHAACVSRHGRGMLLCGPSAAGKSTLAYACARRGWVFTSDDSSYLRHHASDLRVVGNSHQVRFRPSALDLFPEQRGRSITPRAEGKPSIEVPTAELPGIITADEALVHHIILLNRLPSDYAELRPLPREAAQQYFRQYLQLPDKIQKMQLEAAKSIATADVYELRYQDLEQAIECLDLLACD
jgi:hypothetical protein